MQEQSSNSSAQLIPALQHLSNLAARILFFDPFKGRQATSLRAYVVDTFCSHTITPPQAVNAIYGILNLKKPLTQEFLSGLGFLPVEGTGNVLLDIGGQRICVSLSDFGVTLNSVAVKIKSQNQLMFLIVGLTDA